MKILIADALPEDKIEVLRQKGYECIVEPDLTAEQIPEKISGVEILVVRSTKVVSEVFDKSDCLGLLFVQVLELTQSTVKEQLIREFTYAMYPEQIQSL